MPVNDGLSRRDFLTCLGAGAGLALAGASPHLARAGTPGGSRPVCVFSKHLQWLDYDDMAGVAAEVGFDGVDLTVRPGGHVLPERVEEDLPRAVEAVRGAGLAVPMITTAVNDARHPLAEPVLRTAGALGVGAYRMGYLSYDDDHPTAAQIDAYRGQLRELAAMNERFGLHGAYQNHDGVRVGSPLWDLWMMLEGADPRWIGCQYDIRHATVEGGRSWPLDLRLLHPYVRTTVVKDFRWAQRGDGSWHVENVPVGEGMVDFPRYFELVRELGIEGPISLHFEYELPEDGPEAERRRRTMALMRRDLERVRAYLRDAGLS